MILVLLSIERGNKDSFVVAMVVSQDVLITATILDVESPSVICIEL